MRQLAAYLKERENFDSIIRDEGFVSFRIQGEECVIYDLFVSPDFRKKGIGFELADAVVANARANKCKYLTGSVCTTALNATDSAKFILAYGMKIYSAVSNGIIFRKEI